MLRRNLRRGVWTPLIGDRWWIILESAETKSARPDERPIPEIIAEAIHRWIGQWRTLFHPCDDAFWPSIKGGSLAYTYVGHIVTEVTRRELGVPINPHLFRDCAVYTVATTAGTAWASHPAFSSTLTNALWRSITTRAPRSAQLGDISRSLTS